MTPLSWATICGHELVVEQLLYQQDVNPGRPGNQGRTPLSRATGKWREAIVNLLLGR